MSDRRPKSRFRRFAELSASERRLFLEAWFRLLAASIALRLAPRRTIAAALATRRSAPAPVAAGALLEDAVEAVARAAAHSFTTMTCLPRSLALKRLLERRDIASSLRIGIRRNGPAIAAHAWLEVDGRPLGEPAGVEERFLPLLVQPTIDAQPIER